MTNQVPAPVRVVRYSVVNLDRELWVGSYPSYREALEEAESLELFTGQLHGVERS